MHLHFKLIEASLLLQQESAFFLVIVTTRFFVDFTFMCLYMLVCDYLSLGVISWVFVLEGYFGLLLSKGNLVIP